MNEGMKKKKTQQKQIQLVKIRRIKKKKNIKDKNNGRIMQIQQQNYLGK